MSVQTAVESTDAVDVNQRYLTAVLAGIGERLDAVVQGDTTTLPEHPLPEPAPTQTPGLRRLADTLGLSAFEESTLALCAAVELDGTIASKCARAHDNPASAFATFGLALAIFGDPHWSALNPSGPLRHWRLIEPEAGASLTASPLRIDEWAVHYIAGVDYLDQRLASLSDPMPEPRPMVDSHAEIAAALCRSWPQALSTQAGPVACLVGPDAGASRDIVQHVCRALGLRVVATKTRSLPTDRDGQEAFLRLWARQAALTGAVLLIDASDQSDEPQAVSAAAYIVQAAQFPTVLLCRDQWPGGSKSVVHYEVGRPTRDEQRNIWREQLSSDPDLESVDIDAVVGHFSLDAVGIATASTVTIERPPTVDPQSALWDAARRQARPKLDELATRIECRAGWESLILPTYQMALLHDIADHVRHREQVYDKWGFGARSGRGLGVSALFVGQSGTGKTTAAEVVANELRLDLYRIDLSQVVNKYIGETEKNLRRLFDAAEDCGAILLFDEADALFGKRSEVRDSHDRYANIEVSYLLQRMETYRGLAILTTNLDGAIDAAFMRRLRFVVEFGFPDRDQRAEIWRRAFPAETPVGELPVDDLSGLNLTGGNIHNVALGASFLAAADAGTVEIEHVKRAIRAEYAKLGRPVAGDDIRKWS